MLHDMTPVASGIPDGKKNGFVLLLSSAQSFLAPGIPVHRIIGMLEEIGTRFVNQSIWLRDRVGIAHLLYLLRAHNRTVIPVDQILIGESILFP
jgi:hypothetical protein